MRDFVLGARIVNGKGEDLSFGGRVIKNVAGYDVSRLMAGALGTLGVITELSFKVLPRPAAEATLAFELDEASAIEQANRWAGQPLPLSATAWHGRRAARAPLGRRERGGGRAREDGRRRGRRTANRSGATCASIASPFFRAGRAAVAPVGAADRGADRHAARRS